MCTFPERKEHCVVVEVGGFSCPVHMLGHEGGVEKRFPEGSAVKEKTGFPASAC